jgi:hypothetical protein
MQGWGGVRDKQMAHHWLRKSETGVACGNRTITRVYDAAILFFDVWPWKGDD